MAYHVDLNALMGVYTRSYHLLQKLFDLDQQVGTEYCVELNQDHRYYLRIVEQTRYTSLLDMGQGQDIVDFLRPQLQIRLYHDAQLAEVCRSQQISRFAPRYDYPNRRMLQRDEKYQVNRFLSDWLKHCFEQKALITFAGP